MTLIVAQKGNPKDSTGHRAIDGRTGFQVEERENFSNAK